MGRWDEGVVGVGEDSPPLLEGLGREAAQALKERGRVLESLATYQLCAVPMLPSIRAYGGMAVHDAIPEALGDGDT